MNATTRAILVVVALTSSQTAAAMCVAGAKGTAATVAVIVFLLSLITAMAVVGDDLISGLVPARKQRRSDEETPQPDPFGSKPPSRHPGSPW